MNDEITKKIQSLAGLIDQAQLDDVVSNIVSLFNGKIAALEKANAALATRIDELEALTPQLYILAKDEKPEQ